jgi:hypothetical protein
MTASTGALPGRFEQFVGNVARIGIANGLSVFADCFAESHRVGYRFLEHRMQKLDDEFQGSFVVVMKSYLKVAGVRVNVAHWKMPPDLTGAIRHVANVEHIKNIVESPSAQERAGGECSRQPSSGALTDMVARSCCLAAMFLELARRKDRNVTRLPMAIGVLGSCTPRP